MGRRALSDEQKKNYIKDKLIALQDINSSVVKKIGDFEKLSGAELNTVYRKVYSAINYNNCSTPYNSRNYNSIQYIAGATDEANFEANVITIPSTNYTNKLDKFLDKIKNDNITPNEIDTIINKLNFLIQELGNIKRDKLEEQLKRKEEELKELKKQIAKIPF